MDELGDQVKQLANSASCEERHQILDAIKSIYHEIDSDECARARVRSKVCRKILSTLIILLF